MVTFSRDQRLKIHLHRSIAYFLPLCLYPPLAFLSPRRTPAPQSTPPRRSAPQTTQLPGRHAANLPKAEEIDVFEAGVQLRGTRHATYYYIRPVAISAKTKTSRKRTETQAALRHKKLPSLPSCLPHPHSPSLRPSSTMLVDGAAPSSAPPIATKGTITPPSSLIGGGTVGGVKTRAYPSLSRVSQPKQELQNETAACTDLQRRRGDEREGGGGVDWLLAVRNWTT